MKKKTLSRQVSTRNLYYTQQSTSPNHNWFWWILVIAVLMIAAVALHYI